MRISNSNIAFILQLAISLEQRNLKNKNEERIFAKKKLMRIDQVGKDEGEEKLGEEIMIEISRTKVFSKILLSDFENWIIKVFSRTSFSSNSNLGMCS